MKNILLAIFLVISVGVNAQNAYYDAITIADSLDASGHFGPARFSRLRKYYPGLNDNSIATQVSINPFLKSFFDAASTQSVKASGAGNILNNVGGLDVTNIANGVSQLMIDRSKQELTITFFNRFKKFVQENEEVKVLFPKTTDNLENLLTYQYPEMLPVLRTGFFEDLKNMPHNIDDILELDRYKELLRQLPEVRIVLRSLRLVHEIESGYSNAADVLQEFAGLPDWNDTAAGNDLKNMGSAIKVAALFSGSLRNDTKISGDENRVWVTVKEVKTLVADNAAFQIYLGLIYQQAVAQGINFHLASGDIAFSILMSRQKDNNLLFRNLVTEFMEFAHKVDQTKRSLEEKTVNKISLTNDDYYTYINSSIHIIEYAFSIARLFNDDINTAEYTKVARKCNDLYRHIYKEEYPQALINAVDVISSVTKLINSKDRNAVVTIINRDSTVKAALRISSFGDVGKKTIRRINTAMGIAATPELKSQLKLLKGYYYATMLEDLVVKIRKYGLFMANVASAKTPEEVESAINDAILPVGSSSIKKNSSFNISIQSYLGAYVRLGNPGVTPKTNIAWSDLYGVTAPIGIGMSTGLRQFGSISAFVSLIDLGAIVDYRLKINAVADTAGNQNFVVEKDYKVELGQIFSPGIHFVYGFPFNIPLSFGVGGQYGPGLSKIENSIAVVNSPYWRWNAFLAVDIPFFTIKNIPMKKQ